MPNVFQKLADSFPRRVRPSEGNLQGFLRSERSQPVQRFGRKSPITSHLDSLKRLTKMFDPEKAAENDATRGETNIRSGHQSSFEYRVVTAFQNEVNDQRELLEQNIRHKNAVLKDELPPEPLLEGDRIVAKVEAEQDALLSEWEPRLVNAKREVNRSKIELDTFRFNNRPVYARPAKHPNLLVATISMGAILSLEMMLNYSFLLTAGANKPADIFILVFMTALINLGLSAFGLGLYGFRQLGHVKLTEKTKGAVAVLGFGCLVSILHLALAHYRLALDNVLADPAAIADAAVRAQKIAQVPIVMGHTLKTTPRAFLGDLHSVIVFFMGLVFSGIAAVEGYFLIRDPYPKYQAKDQAYQDAFEGFSELMKDFEKEVEKPTRDANEQVSTTVRQGEYRLNSLKMHLDDAVSIQRRYEQEASQLEYAMWQIIDAYRSRYQLLRGAPGPENWQEDMPHLDREVHFELDNIASIEEQEAPRLGNLRYQAAQLHARLTTNLTELLSSLKSYLDRIDKDAKHLEDMARNSVMGVRRPPPPSVEV